MRGRGLSLLETVFSLSLVSMILILVLSIFPDSLLAVRRSEQSLQADHWAESLLEIQTSRPFDALVLPSLYQPPPLLLGPTTYNGQVEVFSVPGTRTDLLKGVRVTVNWEHHGNTYSITQECLVPYAGH